LQAAFLFQTGISRTLCRIAQPTGPLLTDQWNAWKTLAIALFAGPFARGRAQSARNMPGDFVLGFPFLSFFLRAVSALACDCG
jgi:hypothetical protein